MTYSTCRSGPDRIWFRHGRFTGCWEGVRVSAEENKTLVLRFFEEAWVKRNPAAVNMFMAAGYVEHAGFPGSRSSGRDGLKRLIALYRGAFPDLRSTIEDMFAEGDRVAYRWSARGTHLGEWAGISPTGNHMTATGITIFRVMGGKIVEGWVSVDLRRSDEELRWLNASGRVREASPEDGDVPFDPYSSAYDALVRNLTWRIRAEKARERERIEQELRVARQIQQALLPKATPKLDGWQLASYYEPARQVGGDFYDFVELPDGLLGIVVGDATGHGMPAALLMATTRGMLRAVAQSLDSPGEALARVNDAIYPEIPPNMFVTCFYAILDPADGRLLYANAGHDLPYLRRDGQRSSNLWARGMPLGLMPQMRYEENETSLQSGESILFYSDGLVEAHNPHREMFGFPRLRELVDEYGSDGGSLVERLLSELSGFVGAGSEQEDDITLVVLQRLRTT
jgi:serine phosphatase RsbU (regulator of sigma subunit)/predicted ester cyclase